MYWVIDKTTSARLDANTPEGSTDLSNLNGAQFRDGPDGQLSVAGRPLSAHQA
jgi:hypothetical protein